MPSTSRGERHQRTDRGIHLCQALARRAETARERIVAARVEDHQVEPVAGRLHLVQHRIGVESIECDFVFALDLRIHRDQVVAPLDRHAVPGVIEQAETPFFQPVAEVAQRERHLLQRYILLADDGEAGLLQHLGHRARVVERVGQRRGLVRAVADHQRQALLLASLDGLCTRVGCEGKRRCGGEQQSGGVMGRGNTGHGGLPAMRTCEFTVRSGSLPAARVRAWRNADSLLFGST